MKVRTREECIIALQAESSWRKKEISYLSGLTVSGTFDQPTALRASMVLLYAHWEGFVKNSCWIYFSFINEQIERMQPSLSHHFSAILRWKIVRQQDGANSLKSPLLLLAGLSAVRPDNELLPMDIIDTESNLNSVVLRKLVHIVGLDYAPFILKERLIDEVLLKFRNKIAHGDRIQVELQEYQDAEYQILELLEDLQQGLEAAVQLEVYKQAA